MERKRVIDLDLIRFLAIFFVFSVHFFLNSDFYQLSLNSIGTFALSGFRWLFFTCIGLFLLLTGYLNENTKLNRNYIYKLFRILISYFIIGILCLVFKKFYLNEDITIIRGVINLFNFSANDYAWYVEMYVGLFLVIPFLNILYNNLKTKENKIKLLVVLLFIFSLTSTLKFFYPTCFTINAFSDYWIAGYPILYFFLGKYLREFPLKLSKKKMFIILVLTLIVQTGLIFIFNFNKTFPIDIFSGYIGGYYNLFTILEVIMLFSLIKGCRLKNKLLIKGVTCVSLVSFEMYLISDIVDKFYYLNAGLQFGNIVNYLINYLISVMVVFISSFVLAFVINKVSGFCWKKFKIIYNHVCDFFEKIFEKIQSNIIK